MNLQIGDIFVVNNNKQETITILVIEKEQLLPIYKQHYKVEIYYPEGNIKRQSLDIETIEHYVKTKQFIHYPVVK